ncbi:GNAT family N-acetyltransferase [Rubrobacter marinus]|uniref:GNAT family N-acetyltransferase n=1 Tax=Rubrobacter marinus TaxID=2653852 RepID=A0A6G8PUF2_9ACTN|nr:GNAT family protein [Rubrobacter marinus]QIN78004.1 GNAT family N-acetyltransferase [Rubrobacter marinus]
MRRRARGGAAAGGPPRLETERLILRALTPDDAAAVFAYASDPEVARYMSFETHRSLGDAEAFLDLTMGRYGSGDAPDWGLVYKGDGRLIGTAGFVAWEREHARAEVGYILHRDYWGRGLVAEALAAMISYGFEKLDLNRIEARCFAENAASARVMEKAGMTYEGTMRQREFLKGAYRDMKLYAILKDEHRRP